MGNINHTKLYIEKPSTLISAPFDADSASMFDHNTIPDLQGLKELLTGYGVDHSSWGTGISKTVESLHKEMKLGLVDFKWYKGRLNRVVMVVRIHVTDTNFTKELVESHQIFRNSGRERVRPNHNHLNKKVLYRWRLEVPDSNIRESAIAHVNGVEYVYRPPESVSSAASRALIDELSIPHHAAHFEIGYHPTGITRIDSLSSMSYPGLATVYCLCNFHVALPCEYFQNTFEHRTDEMITYFTSQTIRTSAH